MLKPFIAAALLASAAMPAVAAPAAAAGTSVTVSYADLDLGRAEGRAVLARRVRQAIATLCAGDGSGQLADRMATARCTRETMTRADALTAGVVARATRSADRLAAR